MAGQHVRWEAQLSRWLLAFGSGALFSAGLVLSGMTQPRKVRGFLDVFGDWDASLLLVMLGAVSAFAVFYRLSRSRGEPWLGGSFSLPRETSIDTRLLAGAGLFGVGWGLTGLCRGPALAALVSGDARVPAFVAAMLFGMWLVEAVAGQRTETTR